MALITSFRYTPDCWVTDYHFHGQKPWTELQTVTQSLLKVSSLDQRTLCYEKLHFSALPKWGTYTAIQFPCVTGALIRLNFFTRFWFLCSLLSVLFLNFEACDQYTSVWNPFPCWYSASNVQRVVNVLSVFLAIFSSHL